MTDPSNYDEASQTPTSTQAAVTDAPGTEADALADLRREIVALQDRLLRTAAEFDNYRKRVERERRDRADAAMADAIEELLPIIDNLELALDAPVGSDTEVFRKGVGLIHQQMTEALRKRGVTPIQALGTDFDPRVHQAVVHEASAAHREGEVIEDLRKGYMLGERLLRPAMVKVAKA